MATEFDPDEITQAVEDDVELVIREMAFSILRTAVLATPVGNPTLWKNPESASPGYVGGHARRNWRIGIQSAPSGEIEGVDKSGAATTGEAATKLRAYRGFPRVYIVNNAPYIGRLNDGHSKQAPRGFVERAIQAGIISTTGNKVL